MEGKPPRQEKENITFAEFLTIIKDKPVGSSWKLLAEVLGVSPQTIYNWKKLPEAREALAKGIQNSIDKMIETGSNDWRMWREHLKMLGVKDETTTRHELGEGVEEILDALEAGSGKLKQGYDELSAKASEQILEDDPLVQNQGQVGTDSNI